MPMTRSEITQRADARRNREKLLVAAATSCSRPSGTDVSLDAVAKRAGVGIGTLYRHFPTRDALVEAAYRAEVDAPVRGRRGAARRAPARRRAGRVDGPLRRLRGGQEGHEGRAAVVVAGGSDLFAETRGQIVAAIAVAARRGRRGGHAARRRDRRGRLAGDGRRSGRSTTRSRSARLLRLLMDGLRHTAGLMTRRPDHRLGDEGGPHPGALQRPGLDLRAQARRHPLHRDPRRRRR